jgi:arginyl-tRNA synthetase
VHTAHGLYLAPDGKKFSTRKGKTIKLEEVLDEAIRRATRLMEKSGILRGRWVDDRQIEEINTRQNDLVSGNLSRDTVAVGIGAIKYFDLMHSVQSNVVFEWDKIMNMEGNSGPYLQYTIARTNSVLAKKSASQGEALQAANLSNEELLVLRALVRFAEVIESAAKSYSPNLLCNYLYDLAQKYNAFYNKDKIIGGENEEFRLALTVGTGRVLKNGLKILGIETPERM